MRRSDGPAPVSHSADDKAAHDAAGTVPRPRTSPFLVAWLLAGIGLRLFQYLSNRSLFIDEAALALNIRERSFAGLLAPLDHAQAAPIGFLWLQKLITLPFGFSELTLRAPALLAGLAALPLFVALARLILPARLVTAALACFALAEYPIYWSSDVKPYAFDVLACLALILLTLRFLAQPSRRRGIALATAGAIAPFFSHGSVLVLAGVAAAIVLRAATVRNGRLILPLLGWAIAVPAILHATQSLNSQAARYFDAFWQEGFVPWPLAPGAAEMYRTQFTRFLYDPLGFRFGVPMLVATVLVPVGLGWLVLRRPSLTVVLLAPILVVVAASVAGAYPVGARWSYSGRVVLFLAPIVYLSLISAFAWIRSRHSAFVAAVLPVMLAVPVLTSIPWTRGEVRAALAYASERAQPGDQVYLYYGIRQAESYYAPTWRANVVQGVCAQSDRAAYLADLERLRGHSRIWIVMAYDLYRERDLFVEYMRRNATQLDSLPLRLAEVRLYDFSGNEMKAVPRALLAPLVRPDADTDCHGIFAHDTASQSRRTGSATVANHAMFAHPESSR